MKKTLFLLSFFFLISSYPSLALNVEKDGMTLLSENESKQVFGTISGQTFTLSEGNSPSAETIISWDEGATYNKPYTVTDGNSYEFLLQGESGNLFLFDQNTQGIFYVKPNGKADISLIGGEGRPDLTFQGNSVNKGAGTVPVNGAVLNDYGGNVSISGFGDFTLSGNTADGSGGAIYLYSGALAFSDMDSISFKGNTADGAGGAIGSVNGSISFSDIRGDITFSKNTAHCNAAGIQSGSVIYSYGGTILFNRVEGRILVENNTDDRGIGAIKGGNVEFSDIGGGIEFRNNESRAVCSSGSIVFRNIDNGIIIEGHDSGTGQGGALASEAAAGTTGIVFSGINGGISIRNNTGYTGGALSAANAANVVFDDISGGILFEGNVVKSGPAGALRAGILQISNVEGDLIFRNNSSAQDSTSANYGGAIHVSNGGASINGIIGNVILDDNHAYSTTTTRGGVIWSTEQISIENVSGNILLTNNSSSGASGQGGALFSRNKGVSLSSQGNIIIQGNSAVGDSGAVYAAGNVDLTSSRGDIVISGNSAGTSAGAIRGADMNILSEKGNIIIEGNSAGSSTGGALYSLSGTVGIHAAEGKTSFAGNTAKGDGGAIYAGTVNITAGRGGVEFLNNTSTTGQGGAISVSKGLNLNALDGNIRFAGNTAGADKRQTAIFTRTNYSSTSVPVINLNASGANSIVFEDSIQAGKDISININKGTDGSSCMGLVHFKGSNGNILGSSTVGAVLTLNIGSGTAIIEGRVEGSGSVNVGSAATLISGHTSLVKSEDGTMNLSSTTGFESFQGNFVFEQGSRLGTNIRNEGADTWFINMSDVSSSIAAAWGDKATGATISNSLNMSGNVVLGNACVEENGRINVGQGAAAEIAELGAGASVSASGGSVDLTQVQSVDSTIVFGSYDEFASKSSSAQLRIDSNSNSDVKATSLSAEENATTTISQGSSVTAEKMTVANATLENNGSLDNVALLTVIDGTLKGSGTFGNVDVQSGSLIVGNSPGIQTHQNLNLGTAANTIFSINGTMPSDAANAGWASSIYSTLYVNEELTLEAGTTFTLELGSDFLASFVQGQEYTFDLVFSQAITGDLNQINLAYTVYDQETQTSGMIVSPFDHVELVGKGNMIQFKGTARNIPEPGTATMSLLALAALAFSRRRNKA